MKSSFLFQHAMLFDSVSSAYWIVFVLVLQVATLEVSTKGCSLDLIPVPGCRLFSDAEEGDSPEIIAVCTNFDINSTSSLLPNCTKHLEIYRAKNLPTNVPLVPQLSMLSVLELPFNYMHNISKVMFEGLENLSHINLQNNFIKYVPPDTFMNTLNLEVVDISGNYLTTLESVAISVAVLKNLKILYLNNNKVLRWIHDADLIPLTNSSLEALDVSGSLISTIETNAFQPLKFLNSLNISMNPLPEEGMLNLSESLKRDNLKDLTVNEMIDMPYFSCLFLRWLQSTHLESLDISKNTFLCFPKGNYPYLRSITMKKCNILNLDEVSFSGMPKLEFLELQNHMLEGIDKEFKTNILLKFLDLSDFAGISTYTFTIADYTFENQKELSELRLNRLPIKNNIGRYMLFGLKKIRRISLYKDSIRSIDCFAFESLSTLIYLDLSLNFISALSNCTFYGLKNLEVINLSNNALTFFNETHPFQHTPNLESILLSQNKIVKLSSYLFRNLHNIAIISMKGNIIQPWYHQFIPESSNLTSLLLDENVITHFTQQMLDDASRVHFVSFSKNPINCSHCSATKLQEWMYNKSSTSSEFNRTGDYTCHTPNSLKGTDILKADITSATLHCIPKETDFLTPLCTVLSLIICIVVMSMVVWYRWSWNIKYCIFRIQLRIKKYKDFVDSRNFEFDAYVSYCDSNIEWIENHLVPALEDSNPKIRLCLPDRNFDAGCSVLNNIVSAIERSRSTIIIASNDYLDSRWCLYNIQMAQNILFEKTRSGLIIVLLEDIKKDKSAKDLQYVLRTRTCIWWTENPVGQKLFWERLRLAIIRPVDKGISTHIT